MAHETFTRQEQPQGSSNLGFGLVFSGFFALLALLSHLGKLPFSLSADQLAACPYWSAHPEFAAYALTLSLIAVSLVFLVLALVIPQALAPLNWVWTRFGLLLHKIVSPVVLGMLFLLVFTPIGIMMRVFGSDPLRLRFDPKATSYWIERSPPGPAADSLKNQF